MMKGESFTFLSLLPRTARERVIKVFSATWTQRIMLQHSISRVMHLDALVKIWSSPHLKINDLKVKMDQYLQHLLTRAKSPSKYHIVLILLKKLGEYFNHSLCYDFVITQVVIRQSFDSTFIFDLRYKVYSVKAKLQF